MRPLPLALPILAAWSLACAMGPRRVEETEYTRTIEQVTVVPAARAPGAAGPVAPKGALTVEVGATGMLMELPTRTPAEGGPGQFTAADWFGGRAAVGVTDWLEIGVAADTTPIDLSQRAAFRLVRPDEEWLGRGSLQMRFSGKIGEDARFVASLETDITSAPYDRTERLDAVTTHYQGDYGDPYTTVDSDTTHRDGTAFQWAARVGVGAYGEVGPLSLGGGLGAQTMPVFFGQDQDSWTCTRYENGTSDGCGTPDEQDPFTTTLVPSIYGMAAYHLSDEAMILAQPWVNLAAADQDAVRVAPAGVMVGMRFVVPPKR